MSKLVTKKDTEKDINDVIRFFNRQVGKIFKFIDNSGDYADNPTLDKIRILVKVSKAIEPAEMLERSLEKLWNNRDAIIEHDIEFFKSSGVMYKHIKDDQNKEWLTGITDFVLEQYDVFNDDELESIWSYINNMLEAAIKYRLLTGK